jgi:hypothetical protein
MGEVSPWVDLYVPPGSLALGRGACFRLAAATISKIRGEARTVVRQSQSQRVGWHGNRVGMNE